MTCQELDRLLYPYLDGEFQPEERVDLETHLSGCAACRRRVENEQQMRQALRRAARHSVQGMRAPASLRAGIETGLRQEMRRAQYGNWLRASAVALVMVTMGGGWVAYQSMQRERIVKREAVQRHSKPLPFEIESTSTEPIAEWFRGKVDRRIAVPQLPKAKPLGGRISILNGREVAYISYETLPDAGEPSRRLGVFVLPDDTASAPKFQALKAVEVDSTQGFNVVTWRDDEIVYEMVTDMDEADIRRMLAERDSEATLARKPQRDDSEETPWSLPPRQQSPRPAATVAPVTYPH
ncbi:transmembrane regulator PrtR [Pyxidicoccus fallax]|uniref:Transmembrane regulator PrtR n=1 Tax=Pyxidicoccus fallax TaxID=394095 RepID=A0A848LTK5_9BACT|nr:zf-HC2 domain-containing protein [Pyxidicoccus fallax]NMO20724.1 transmembrane regulator PrtR [Pyxidicoccus fallax]NPC81713.1 transmembrane regulator PrtR [Pyxidicoccus fallax]